MFNDSNSQSSQCETTYATVRSTHDTQYHKYTTRHHRTPTTYYTQDTANKIQNLLSVSWRGRKEVCYWLYNVFVHASQACPYLNLFCFTEDHIEPILTATSNRNNEQQKQATIVTVKRSHARLPGGDTNPQHKKQRCWCTKKEIKQGTC